MASGPLYSSVSRQLNECSTNVSWVNILDAKQRLAFSEWEEKKQRGQSPPQNQEPGVELGARFNRSSRRGVVPAYETGDNRAYCGMVEVLRPCRVDPVVNHSPESGFGRGASSKRSTSGRRSLDLHCFHVHFASPRERQRVIPVQMLEH